MKNSHELWESGAATVRATLEQGALGLEALAVAAWRLPLEVVLAEVSGSTP